MPSDTTSAGFEGSAPGHGATSDDLEKQIAKLREDVAGVRETLNSMAAGRAENARQQIHALRDDVRERSEQYLHQAQDAIGDLEDQVSEKVRAEPIKSVLIAAAIGYVYARLFH